MPWPLCSRVPRRWTAPFQHGPPKTASRSESYRWTKAGTFPMNSSCPVRPSTISSTSLTTLPSGYCFCRQRRSLLGDPCDTHAPTLNCFTFGKSARHTAAQGFARKVTKEEARKIMQEAEAAGLIHKAFHPRLPRKQPRNEHLQLLQGLLRHPRALAQRHPALDQFHLSPVSHRCGSLHRLRHLCGVVPDRCHRTECRWMWPNAMKTPVSGAGSARVSARRARYLSRRDCGGCSSCPPNCDRSLSKGQRPHRALKTPEV